MKRYEDELTNRITEKPETRELIDERSLISDKYRQIVCKNATTILNSLFSSISTNISELKTINILVIGAGTFPSIMPFITTLQRLAPKLEAIIFTLVEPFKSKTDCFHGYFLQLDFTHTNAKVEYSIQNTDIYEYLKSTKHTYFDIIYFEQPDMLPYGILLAKIGLQTSKLNLSLHKAIPLLKNVARPNTIIMACFLFKRDLKQLNSLIKYSLNIPTRIVYLSMFSPSNPPFSSGLISIIGPTTPQKEESAKIVSSIKNQDDCYAWFVLISILLFIMTPPAGKLLSFFCFMAMLMHHRYGLRNIIIKSAIVLIQISIMLMVIYAIGK